MYTINRIINKSKDNATKDAKVLNNLLIAVYFFKISKNENRGYHWMPRIRQFHILRATSSYHQNERRQTTLRLIIFLSVPQELWYQTTDCNHLFKCTAYRSTCGIKLQTTAELLLYLSHFFFHELSLLHRRIRTKPKKAN